MSPIGGPAACAVGTPPHSGHLSGERAKILPAANAQPRRQPASAAATEADRHHLGKPKLHLQFEAQY